MSFASSDRLGGFEKILVFMMSIGFMSCFFVSYGLDVFMDSFKRNGSMSGRPKRPWNVQLAFKATWIRRNTLKSKMLCKASKTFLVCFFSKMEAWLKK